MFLLGDAFALYVFDFAREAASQNEESPEEAEATKQKFVGLALFLIGFALALIFGEDRPVAGLALIVYALTLAERVLLRSSLGGANSLPMLYESADEAHFALENSIAAKVNLAKA